MPDANLLFRKLFYFVAVLNLVDEDLCGLETWNEMFINDDGRVARNIARYFLLPLFIDKTSEAPNINIMPCGHGVFYNGKECFHGGGDISLVDACLLRNLINNVCFRHGAGVLFAWIPGRQN